MTIHEQDIAYEARKEGREEGKLEAQIETAKKMLKRNMSYSDIIEITGLTEQEIRNIEATE